MAWIGCWVMHNLVYHTLQCLVYRIAKSIEHLFVLFIRVRFASTVSFIVLEPRLPPMMRMVFFICIQTKMEMASGFLASIFTNLFWQDYLSNMILSLAKIYPYPHKQLCIFRAFQGGYSIFLQTNFVSCIRVGMPIQFAYNVGQLAYPPTPITTSGLYDALIL